MTLRVLICDDSSMARKQMARALPQDWDVDVAFANNGAEGLEAIRDGQGDVLFLDLNMPVMDGYQVLEAVRAEDLSILIIVVSGDVQPEAYARVMQLGALAFIRKPVEAGEIAKILDQYGIRGNTRGDLRRVDAGMQVDFLDGCQEIANVAMGRAGDLLARVLGVFVQLPVPRVNLMAVSELRMALQQVDSEDGPAAVCQGFIGAGIAGEALLMFDDASFSDIARLMNHSGDTDEAAQFELLMDIANILLGACLTGIADQLDVSFSQGHPVVLGRHVNISDLLTGNAARWKNMLAIEISYSIEGHNINCESLVLLTEDSVPNLKQRLSYIID